MTKWQSVVVVNPKVSQRVHSCLGPILHLATPHTTPPSHSSTLLRPPLTSLSSSPAKRPLASRMPLRTLRILNGMGLLGSWVMCAVALWPIAEAAGLSLVDTSLAQLAAGAVGTLLMVAMADKLSRRLASAQDDDEDSGSSQPWIDDATASAAVWAGLLLVTGLVHFSVAYSLDLLSMGESVGALLPGRGDNTLLYHLFFNAQMIDSLLWAFLCGVYLLPPYTAKALQHQPSTTAVKAGYAPLVAADFCC